MWLKALHKLENLCSPWSLIYKKIQRNELQARLIKQEQAAVLQVVNYDQTNFVLFWVNNASQNIHEFDVSLTNHSDRISWFWFHSTTLTPQGLPGVSREAKLSTELEFGSLVR